MEVVLVYIVVVIYIIALLMIFIYSIAQLNLLLNYLSATTNRLKDSYPEIKSTQYPNVTIQLPVYNELYVIDRLLDCIAAIDYPHERLQIQVLDDSTDESLEQTRLKIEKLRITGLDIVHVTRTDRNGFKAGALKEGLKFATGDLIAIFDADFMPASDWLKKTVPFFVDPEIGVVQTRWGHLNRNYSFLTKVQAFALDAHFTIEQVGRNSKGHFINFNGTAGIWRKECIIDAGNWEGDTLTEDLDLSYRAQLRNWKFKYLEEVETPAELPVLISAARSQQFRWNKGGAENFRKTAASVVRARNIDWRSRVHGILHLLNSSMFLFAFIIAILSIPVMFIQHYYPEFKPVLKLTGFFLVSSVILFLTYWITFKRIKGGGFLSFLSYIPMFFGFFAVALGFSLNNSIAVIQGHLGKRSSFVRTPKFNLSGKKDTPVKNKYISRRLPGISIPEMILTAYFLFGILGAWQLSNYGMMFFSGMLCFGFGFVTYLTIKNAS
ncbi:cellulose synthase family protein [Robertkochia solimangrovi]|uniref:cellulose synthase family protein n=1 Tax=Robertkochia solimangrovi TaxID=2213046 RepID=UPI0011802552|nr:cellulose synthase family protein [Robertkochia solimangrovi]TRZ43285.1 glycosyl transferase family 2 [Robertkochia solimangrovi]